MDRLISEQAVIDRLTRWYSDMLETGKEKENLVDVIKAIPSANALEWETTFDKFMRKQKSKEADMREYWKKELNISSDVAIPSAEPKSRWISVSKKLPIAEEDVLVCNSNGHIEICSGYYSTELEEVWVWLTSGWQFGEVIAWMPLPQPYKAECEG